MEALLADEQTRISVGITRDEMTEIQQLAYRCNTSVSALGQLALRHLLLQARSGAIPMMPATPPAADPLTNRERRDGGMLTSIDALQEESQERFDKLQTKIAFDMADDNLARLDDLTSGESSPRSGEAPRKT